MLITKVHQEEYGVAITNEGKLTDLYGDGNLYDIDEEYMMRFLDKETGEVKPYDSYAKFDLCGTTYLVLFETADEYKAFSKQVDLY